MEMIVPRPGIKATSLALVPSVLSLHHVGSLMSALYLCLPASAAPCLRGQCRLVHSYPCNFKYFNAYKYIHTRDGLTYTYTGRFNNDTAQHIACTGSCSGQPVSSHHGCDVNGKYHAKRRNQMHTFVITGQCDPITPHRLPNASTIPTPTYISLRDHCRMPHMYRFGDIIRPE